MMTPEEHARAVVAAWEPSRPEHLLILIAATIRAAVEAETERCAKVVEAVAVVRVGHGYDEYEDGERTLASAAAAIRAAVEEERKTCAQAVERRDGSRGGTQ